MSDMSHQDARSKAEREFFEGSWFNPPSINAVADLEQRVKLWRWVASIAIALAAFVGFTSSAALRNMEREMEREVAEAWMEMDSAPSPETDGLVYFSVQFDEPTPQQVNYYVSIVFDPGETPDSTVDTSEDPEDGEEDPAFSSALYLASTEFSL